MGNSSGHRTRPNHDKFVVIDNPPCKRQDYRDNAISRQNEYLNQSRDNPVEVGNPMTFNHVLSRQTTNSGIREVLGLDPIPYKDGKFTSSLFI